MSSSENFKPVEGFPDYRIGDKGTLISLKSGIPIRLSARKHSQGYLTYSLCFQGKVFYFLAHRLVAQHYIPNPQNKPNVNHINGNKQDNRVENLEWCTPSENNKHAVEIGCFKDVFQDRKGTKNDNCKLTEDDVKKIRSLLDLGVYQYEIAVIFGVGQAHISRIKRGKLWSHLK